MSTLVLGRTDAMSNETDPGWWIAPAAGISAIAIGWFGWLAKTIALAWSGGRSTAEMEGRLDRVEDRQKLNMDAILAYQARTDNAIAGLLAKSNLIDGELRNVATREELKEELRPILEELRDIRRERRGGFTPPQSG
jgi:hypothetical protein